jgi:glycerol uptake facilitator-like aquaporin
MRQVLLEGFGCFCIAFFGCLGAYFSSHLDFIGSDMFGGAVSGATLAILVKYLGPVTGGHVSPSISLAFLIQRRFDKALICPYFAAHIAGSLLGGGLYYVLIGANGASGLNLPAIEQDVTVWEAFLVEVYVSATMMLVILHKYPPRWSPYVWAFTGAIVAFNIWLFGSTHGAAMNPARALGPLIMFGEYTQFVWIYTLGPIIGCALVAVATVPEVKTINEQY